MNGEFIPWFKEIRTLAADFFVNKATVERIIKDVRQKYHANKGNNDYMYDRAYSLLKPVIYGKLEG